MLRSFRGQLLGLAVQAVSIVWTASPATADVQVSAQQCKAGPSCIIYEIHISGPIDEAAPGAFARALDDPRLYTGTQLPTHRVILNSLGGSVSAAMAVGELIRKHGFGTWVFVPDECSSACVLVLAAGVQRNPFGRIGIHRPHFDEALFAHLSLEEARRKYEQMAERVRNYLARMGMDAGLYLAMLRIPSNEVRILSPPELRAFGLEGEDPTWAEWTRARGTESEGLENYTYHEVVTAVLNARCDTGLERCLRQVESAVSNGLSLCSSRPSADYIACAKALEQRLISSGR